MTLGRKLALLLIAVATAPLVLAQLLAHGRADAALASEIGQLQTRAAVAESEHAADFIEGLASELQGALQDADVGAMTPAEVQEFLSRVFLRRRQISIAALLQKGHVTATTFVDDPEAFAKHEPEFKLHDTVSAEESRDFLNRAAALAAAPSGGRFSLSAPYITQTRGRPALALFIPPRGRGQALAAEIALADLAEHLSRASEGGEGCFLDSTGRVVLHPVDRPRGTEVDWSRTLAEAVGPREPGVGEYTVARRSYLAGFSAVNTLGWVAVLARPRDDAMLPLEALARSTALALGFSLLSALGLALVSARAMSRPIGALTAGARALGRGEYGHRILLERKDELGDLARTFNEMGGSIEEANRKLTRFNESLQQQVEERTRDLREAQAQLLRTQRLAAMGDFSAGLTHEMNNPLAIVMGNIQLALMDTPESDPRAQLLKDVEAAARRVAGIVERMRSLVELEKGTFRPVDVKAALDSALDAATGALKERGIELIRHYDARPTSALGDAVALTEVFRQLIDNARNALDGRPVRRLTVTTSLVDGSAVKVEVEDTGCGIAAEHLERIFNPFFTTKRKWTGAGLALSVCHRVVEGHGGRIFVKSQEGQGTLMTVVLPGAPPPSVLR